MFSYCVACLVESEVFYLKKVEAGHVVCCPKCGTVSGNSEVSVEHYYCSNKKCNTRFTGWVVNGFVITFETVNETSLESIDRFGACKEKLIQLLDFCN